jgi:hypothetical protein
VDAPEVPAITTAQLTKAGVIDTSKSSIVARTVIAKPVNVKKPSPLKGATSSDSLESNAKGQTESSARGPSKDTSSFDDGSSDEEDAADRPLKSVIRQSLADTSPDSPFADTQATQVDSSSGPALNTAVSTSRNSLDGKGTHRQRSSVGSTRLLEEALTNAANDSKPQRESTHSRTSSQRNASPFSDANEVKSS